MYEIALEGNDVIIRVSADLVDKEALSRLLSYIEMESIRKKSRLTEEQAAELAKELDLNVWETVKKKPGRIEFNERF